MIETVCTICDRVYKSAEDYMSGTSRFRVCEDGHLYFECSCKTCHVLPKGAYEWYDPAKGMSEKAATLFQQLKQLRGLPPVPTSIMELQTLIANPNSNSQAIEKGLKDVPSVAVQVLTHANYAAASKGKTFDSIEHAISYIGRQAVNILVLAASIKNIEFKSKLFDKDAYWHESTVCGRIAEAVARQYGDGIPTDEAYLAASMCNIGKLVMAVCLPKQADKVAKLSKDPAKAQPWPVLEKKALVPVHTVLGEVAAALWGFPNFITHATCFHHTPSKEVKELEKQVPVFFLQTDPIPTSEAKKITHQKIVALSNQLCHLVLDQPHRIDEELLHDYQDVFGFDDVALRDLVEKLKPLQQC